MAKSRVITSARVAVYVNGKRFGRVTAFTWDADTNKRVINGIDSITAYELATTTAMIKGTVGVVRTTGDGGIEGAGIAASFKDLANEKYFTISLVDLATDNIIFQADHCSVISQTWSIPAKGLVTGSFIFQGISWANETEK